MTLIKRGKMWHTRIVFEGRLYQKSLHTRQHAEAIRLEAAFRTSLVRREFDIIDSSKLTLETFRTRMFAHLKANVAPRTYEFYENCYDVLTNFTPLAVTRLGRIDTPLIEQFIQWRLKQNVEIVTVNHALRTLRRALHLAEDWKLIRHAPKISLLRGENSREYVISDETLRTMISWIATAYPTSVMMHLLPFLVDTGLRISEACDLRRDNISFEPKPGAERGYVYIEKGKSKYAKRYVPLTERAVNALREVLKQSRCEYVFTSKGGRRQLTRHYPTQQFRLIADALSLPEDAVLHSTRHTFCTRLGESGADAFTIQRLAGHSSITISQKYVHPTPTIMESAIGKMEAVRTAKAKKQAEKAAAASASGEQSI